MSRFKPVTKLDVIGNLSLSPENVTGKITELRMHKDIYLPPNWDSLGDGVELLAVQNDKEHQLMLKLQAEMLESAEQQSSINTQKIAEISKLQCILRRRFIEANNFFKDCDDKKKFAKSKVSEEKLCHSDLRRTIKTCSEKIKVLKEFRQTLKITVAEFEPYEEVFNNVINEGLYSSVKDCTTRCDALLMTQVEINEKKQLKIKEIEELKVKMTKKTKDAALAILGLNNELHNLEKSYAKAHSECQKWESVLVKTKDALMETENIRSKLFDELNHMTWLLSKHRESTVSFKKGHNMSDQFDFIRDEIKILRKVVKECHRGI